jgi:predicted CxxxxCH...CXXCH cytochrome family protein
MCHGADLQGGPVGIGCASCHGQGWQSNCTFCHGEKLASYTPADLVRAAPPQGTQNEEAASARAVGAHQSHVRAGTVAPAFGCDECHPLPTDLSHVNGDAVAVNMAFGALANHGGFVSTFATGPATCTTYCHSALDRGAVETPAWATVDGSPGACGACHGLPPAFLRGGGHHMANPNCGGCHGAGYSATTVATATHVNGNVELEDMTCSSCHGDGNRTGNALLKAAPPVGTAGQTATTERGVGAHQKHVASTLASPVPCAECHDVPDPSVPASLAHSDGQVLVLFGPLATGSGAVPVWNPGVATCSSTYCHGNYRGTYTYTRWDWGNDVPETVTYDYVGSAATPTWTASAACGSCHGAPPVGGSWHGNHGGYNTCETCHPDAQGRPGSAVITNATLHVNGQVDVYAPKTSRCFGCH